MRSLGRTTSQDWPKVSFGEIFHISSSKRVLEAQWKPSGVPFYRAREIVKLAKEGTVQNELFISEDLFNELQSRYGAPIAGDLMISAVGTLGACYVVQPSDRFYYKDASVLRFSPKKPVWPRFIQHAFLTNEILDQVNAGSGSTVGTYTISRANETKLRLPPLAEQKRIAEVLDRAEALRAKRRAALALLDSLSQALFIEMFGDPVTNPMGWKTMPFGAICERVTVGIVVKPASHYRENGVVALRSLNVKPGKFVLDDIVYFSRQDNETKLQKTKLKAGDLVIVRTGQPGNAAVVPPELDGANAIDLLIATPDRRQCDETFLCAFINSSAGRALVLSSQRGQVQKHLNVGSLYEAIIPIPPLALQQEFARRIRAVEKLKASHRAALAELDALFAALQHRAFRGEL